MGSVGGWLSAAVTLCVFVIFHKLSGHEAEPSERENFPAPQEEQRAQRETGERGERGG